MQKVIGWFSVGLLVLVLGAAGYLALTRDAANARVAEDIRQNPAGARAAKTMLLTMADGRMYPVNYLHEGNKVFMGIDGRWWREFVGEGQPVSMFIKGESYEGHAVTKLDDPDYIKDIFSRLRPTVPKWLPDALNGKLVVITLKEPAGESG